MRVASGKCEGGETPHPVLACGGLFFVFFLARIPRLRRRASKKNQGVIGESPDREISNPRRARHRQQGGQDERRDTDLLRVLARADQEIPRSRSPRFKGAWHAEEDVKARDDKGQVYQHELDREIPRSRSPGFGRQRHKSDRCERVDRKLADSRRAPRRQRGR